MISHSHTLKKLKEFGFKTFSDWWDESYDTEEDDSRRSARKEYKASTGLDVNQTFPNPKDFLNHKVHKYVEFHENLTKHFNPENFKKLEMS